MKKISAFIILILILLTAGLAACVWAQSGFSWGLFLVNKEEKSPSSYEVYRAAEPGEYDSMDTAVLSALDIENKQLTFLNIILKKHYTLSYDGITCFYDTHGTAVTAERLRIGDIADLKFLRSKKLLTELTLSPSAWKQEVKSRFELDTVKNRFYYDGGQLALYGGALFISDEEEILPEELNSRDVLQLQGIGNTVYSLKVMKGHGYLRLENGEYFTGGYIDIGETMTAQVTDGMLLTVPEGHYNITLKNGKHGGTLQTDIYRDEETLLNVESLKGAEPEYGNVLFTLAPADADVYIDGEKCDTSAPVSLEYGIHQMIVRADGYETLSQYLRISRESSAINITLEEDSQTEEAVETPEEVQDPGDGAYMELPTEEEMRMREGLGPVEPSPYENPPEFAENGYTQPTDGLSAYENLPEFSGDTNTQPVDGLSAYENLPVFPGDSGILSPTAYGEYSVHINAPESAELYIDGSYVGIVPCSFKKTEGSHVVSLRKNGYQTRSYTIQVDDSQKDMELSFSELVLKK